MEQRIVGPARTVDSALRELRHGADAWRRTGHAQRVELLRGCLDGVRRVATEWVAISCARKHGGLPAEAAAAAAGEEIAAGPLATARHLRLLLATHTHLAAGRLPPLPPRAGAAWNRGAPSVPVFPTRELLDRFLFRGFAAVVRTAPDQPLQTAPPCDGDAQVCVVLGAGNVTSLPVTDALHHVFVAGRAVLLKLSPIHEPLLPSFEHAFGALIGAGVLRIVAGPPALGAEAVHHALADAVHLTGSAATAAALREGTPPLRKPFTAELGNVTPVLVLPGRLSHAELEAQAEQVATMLVNNASSNCIAVQLLVTWRGWEQRTGFLDAIERVLARVPARHCWYPGSLDRFRRFCPEVPVDGERVPWILRRDVDPSGEPGQRFRAEEVFAGAMAEVALPARDAAEFQRVATRFLNDEVWGDLGVTVLAPRGVDPAHAVDHLRYGTVGVNQWCGLGYAWMSPPWGAFPGGVSGAGFVHNTFLLTAPIKTIVTGPLRPWPKPPWFVTHARGMPVLRALCRYYLGGGWRDLASVVSGSLRP